MGRPASFDSDQLLDAAAALAAVSPERVTMTAVAAAAGAPSGSLYHRFAGRPALLGELWVRTVSRFQAGFLAALAAADPVAARVNAAVHVIAWSREHPDEARLLLRGAAACGEGEWPPELGAASATLAAELERALDELAARTPGRRQRNRELLAFVAIDAPYATVRRHLRAGATIPAGAERLVEQCARTLAGSAPAS
jgi:AcrR family transcriptional regulator